MKKKSTARRHHYLPQAYLAAFTDTGFKDGKLHALDVDNGNRFRTSPINVAIERDFNRIDIEGEPLDILEQALASFEDPAIRSVRNVNNKKTFPCDEDHTWILNLLCLIAIRNPRQRRSLNQFRETVMHRFGDLLVSNEKIYKSHLKKAQKADHTTKTSVSYEEMKSFISERRYEIKFPPGSNFQTEFGGFDKLLQILGQRYWSLFVAPISGPEFICSDHPVALTWKNTDCHSPIGYGLKNTEVFFPLGPHTGFYGVYEETLHEVVELTPAQVVMMNRRVVNNAERHIFSKKAL